VKGTGNHSSAVQSAAIRNAIILAFVIGTFWVQQWPELPAAGWCLIAVAPLICWRPYPRYRVLYAGILGICWAVSWGHWKLRMELPESMAGKDLLIEGYIASIPDAHERGLRFDFAVEAYPELEQAVARTLPRKVRLSWYGSEIRPVPVLLPGEHWRLMARLKPSHGFMNPGAFDYEAWLFGQGIRATGYVRADEGNRRLREAGWHYALQRLRHEILERIHVLAPAGEYTGLVAALAIGHQHDIRREQWRLLTDTGTIHLISISGLHVSMIAGLCYLLAYWLHAALLPWLSASYPAWPAQRTGAVAGLCSALAYSALAGFALPTVRSLLMLAVAFGALFFYRQLRPWQALLTALALVVAVEPFALNGSSFWLSFGAVAVLIYLLSGRFRAQAEGESALRRRWRRWGYVQFAIIPALIPLTLFWFGRAVLTAAAANFVAIPWVSAAVVPVILLATAAAFISEPAAALLFAAAVRMLDWLWRVLDWLSHLPWGQRTQHPPQAAALALAAVGLVWLLAPRGVPARWAGIACLLPLFWRYPAGPAEGDVWFTVLDVGQGTAAVVRTRRHALLYDAGPRFSDNFDAGSAAVVPYLRAQGVRYLDMLVVSHSHDDHQGGVESVLREISARTVLAGEPDRYPAALPPAGSCARGQRWRWDGVDFEILWPPPDAGAMRTNNVSCVLRITAPGGSILLPGDIEREAERSLWQEGALAPVDILLLPHHGSRTSSTPPFVMAVRPRYAVATADYRNRYGFPGKEVAGRYREAGASMLVTGYTGAVEFRLDHASGVAGPVLYRHVARRYWRHLPVPED
jgi:competence protein ComEC